MLRVRGAVGWTWAVVVESPTPQFAVPSSLSGAARSNIPDLPGFVRYERSRGQVQVAGLLRQLRFDGGECVDNDSAVGGGVNVTFGLKTLGSDLIQGQDGSHGNAWRFQFSVIYRLG